MMAHSHSNDETFYKGLTSNGEWFSGYNFISTHSLPEDVTCQQSLINDKGEICNIIPESLCEFVGLTDINNHEEFENDIIKCKTKSNEILIGRIIRNSNIDGYYCKFHLNCNGAMISLSDLCEHEVIGNSIQIKKELIK